MDKQSNTTATYYNNKSTNLHFFGSTVLAKATTIRQVSMDVEKQKAKSKSDRKKTTRGVESLDIPSVPPPTSTTIKTGAISPVLSPSLTTTKTSSSQKKSNLSSNNNIKISSKKSKSTTASTINTTTTTSTNNIPRTPQSNTPRPSSTPVPHEKLSDRVVQLLALRPYQISTMAKILDCTQWDVKKIVDDVALLLPDPSQKKKYCLKPSMYKKTRIWDWPSYTHEEKLTVFDNVTEAYDLLQIPIDSPERNNLINPASPTSATKLIQPPPGRVQITTERDRAIAAKKSSNHKAAAASVTPISNGSSTLLSDTKLFKPEKRNSPDVKGNNKGKTTPSGFTYAATTPEPPAPSPSTTTTTTTTSTTTPTSRSSPSGNKLKSTQRLPPSHQLKPSSSNKKVGSKALPQVEKCSPPTKRKVDHAPSTPPPPPPKKTPAPAAPAASSPMTSSKRLKSSSSSSASSNDEPHDIELLKIVSQSMFDKYCAKFITSQKDYQHTKTKFIAKYPQYIRALETTGPPKTGIKRSYYDTKVEYYDMVKHTYLKAGDESSWKEAEALLNEWNLKRRRLNYMWNSIEKNMKEHRYQLNYH
ncbi:unnamed protein product [Mucor hiemalis]